MTSNDNDDYCDIDALAELLDEEDETTVSAFKSESTSQPASSSICTDTQSNVLQKKLEEMEKQMAQLKQQLKNQNSSSGKTGSTLTDVGLNFEPKKDPSQKKAKIDEGSALKDNIESESSDEDEEGNRIVKTYSEFGQFVKQRLAHQPSVDRLKGINCPQGWKSKQGALTKLSDVTHSKPQETPNDNGFTDPFFGIKIVNPLLSSITLAARMEGRKPIKLSQIKMYMKGGDIKDDWVTMATVVSKGEPRTSQKGKKYSIWKLSDLKDCTTVVSFFLFGEVFNTHWKMAVGSVIGILNPNFMKDDKKSDEISFTIDNPQKILLIGSSKDLGWCRATRKDGSRCPAFVNKSDCEFCVYHVQSEFKKTSAKRADIQSSFSGTGLSAKDRLQQKVLGKQEVFYGGQLFSGKVVAPPASKAKDNKILSNLALSDHARRIKEEEELAKQNVKVEFTERLKNPTAGARNLLRCMEGGKNLPSPMSSPACSKIKSITARELLQQHKQQLENMKNVQLEKVPSTGPKTPLLGRGLQPNDSEIDLTDEVRFAKPTHPKMEAAKLKALRLVQRKGPLKPSDPNNPFLKPSTPELQAKIRKRALDGSNDEALDNKEAPHVDTPRPPKRTRAEIEDLMEAKSSHSELISAFEDEQADQYFSKLERKEQLENKMLDTFEIKTTAVTCSKCKYTALSASELCRKESHPLRTVKAVKRFFQCKDCKKRTMSLDRLPKQPCSNCNGNSWERAAMAKERKGPVLPHEELLVRGEEVKYLNR